MDRREFLNDLAAGYFKEMYIPQGSVHLHLLLQRGQLEWAIRTYKSSLCGTDRCRKATLVVEPLE